MLAILSNGMDIGLPPSINLQLEPANVGNTVLIAPERDKDRAIGQASDAGCAKSQHLEIPHHISGRASQSNGLGPPQRRAGVVDPLIALQVRQIRPQPWLVHAAVHTHDASVTEK